MREEHAPGLVVDWLNGWLAALGITALLPEVRLSWTGGAVPHAGYLLPADAPPLAELVAAAMPTLDEIDELAIARRRSGCAEFTRNVSLGVYAERAQIARATGDWSLSATLTDLVTQIPRDGLPHSPFDPPVPKGITIWQRLRSCREAVTGVEDVECSLMRLGRRIGNNGLGFDARRLVAGVRQGGPQVDPVIEVLAFFGVACFPARGTGREARARGWLGPGRRPGSFRWCSWAPALDRWAIDALLDLAPRARDDTALARRLGIGEWYLTVPFRPLGPSDVTRAYGAERFR
ncbi:MAG: hypothetical protein M5T61_17020 [Acidimicrobiia bacterium]|nr:hypothetical protein [Acidimicrobiia bacterium]